MKLRACLVGLLASVATAENNGPHVTPQGASTLGVPASFGSSQRLRALCDPAAPPAVARGILFGALDTPPLDDQPDAASVSPSSSPSPSDGPWTAWVRRHAGKITKASAALGGTCLLITPPPLDPLHGLRSASTRERGEGASGAATAAATKETAAAAAEAGSVADSDHSIGRLVNQRYLYFGASLRAALDTPAATVNIPMVQLACCNRIELACGNPGLNARTT